MANEYTRIEVRYDDGSPTGRSSCYRLTAQRADGTFARLNVSLGACDGQEAARRAAQELRVAVTDVEILS